DLGIADARNVVPPEGAAIMAAVEDDKMVAQAVHLDEGPLGGAAVNGEAVLHVHRRCSRFARPRHGRRGNGWMSGHLITRLWLAVPRQMRHARRFCLGRQASPLRLLESELTIE